MKKMKSIVRMTMFLISVFIAENIFAQELKSLLDDFKSSDWKLVKEAEIKLENLQGLAIPDLIVLLDSKEVEKLQNTGSLIYPGAEKFFGHGQLLEYDIDNLAIRAGWLLEEISFMNFGFSGIHLPKDEAISYIRQTYPAYYSNSTNRNKVDNANDAELRNIIQTISIDSAKEWWEDANSNFSRLDQLLGALKSFDEKRQVKALFYMRNGVTKCDGLTRDVYYEDISKEIVRLSGSDVQRIAEHAKLILLDSKLDWLAMKNQ